MKIEENVNVIYMNLLYTPIIVHQESSIPLIIYVLDVQHMNSIHPSIFDIHSEFIRNNIPIGMWIKCGIKWENSIKFAWIEVIDSILNENGQRQYIAAFNEFNLGELKSGAFTYDIGASHIMDIDIERFKQISKR